MLLVKKCHWYSKRVGATNEGLDAISCVLLHIIMLICINPQHLQIQADACALLLSICLNSSFQNCRWRCLAYMKELALQLKAPIQLHFSQCACYPYYSLFEHGGATLSTWSATTTKWWLTLLKQLAATISLRWLILFSLEESEDFWVVK